MASVFVRGFDFETSEAQIKKHCMKAGKITSAEMWGRGGCVVHFASEDQAQQAVDTLNGTTIAGNSRFIDVKLNDESKGNKRKGETTSEGAVKVFVRGFDFGTTDEQFEGHMSPAGTIEKVQWCTKGSAIVTFSSQEEADTAVETLNGTTIEGNSRFIDVILKEDEDGQPPAKKFKGSSKGSDKGSGKGKGDAKGQWAWIPAAAPQDPWGAPSWGAAPAAQVWGKSAGKGKGKGKFDAFAGKSAGKGKGKFEAPAGKSAGKGKGKVREADPAGSGRVFVRGFDFDTTDEMLHDHCGSVGSILNTFWCTKGSAILIYQKKGQAKAAVQNLHNTTIPGNSRFIDVILKDSE